MIRVVEVSLAAAVLLASCALFEGPATHDVAPMTRCKNGGKCPRGMECTPWPDQPCRAAPDEWERLSGAARDAGRD